MPPKALAYALLFGLISWGLLLYLAWLVFSEAP